MAHAVKIRASPKKSEGNPPPGAGPDWGPDVLHERMVDEVYGEGFDRVLAGDATDPEHAEDDQESPMSLREGAVDNRPDHLAGLYRTADRHDINEFVDAIEKNVVFDAKWYSIEPHDCTHDREEGGPCKVYDGEDLVDKIAERGNVPDTVSFA